MRDCPWDPHVVKIAKTRCRLCEKHILWYVQLSQFELLTLLQDLFVLYFLVFCMQADVLLKIHAHKFYSVMSWVLCWIYYFLRHQSQHFTTALTMPRQFASKGLMILHHDSIHSLSDHLNRRTMDTVTSFLATVQGSKLMATYQFRPCDFL